MTEKEDLVEWELNVPDAQVLAFYREPVWETLVRDPLSNWDNLIVTDRPVIALKDIGAWVKVPLLREWVTCHGQLEPKYPTR